MEAGTPPTDQDEVARRLERARELLRLHRTRDALAEIASALQADPDLAEAEGLRALCLALEEDREGAVAAARRCLALDPDDGWSHFVMARVCLVQDRLADARTAIDDAILRDPLSPVYREERAQIHLAAGRFDRCLADAEEGLRLDPESVGCTVARALALHGLGRLEEAEEAYRRALALDPEEAVAHEGIGLLALGRTRPGKAAQSFADALRLDPSSTSAARGQEETLLLGLPGYGAIHRIVEHLRAHSGEVVQGLSVVVGVPLLIIQVLLVVMAGDEWLLDPGDERERGGWWTVLALSVAFLTWAWTFALWVLRPLFPLALLFHPRGRHLVDRARLRPSLRLAAGLACVLFLLVLSVLLPWNRGFALAVLVALSLPALGALARENPGNTNLWLILLLGSQVPIGLLGAIVPGEEGVFWLVLAFVPGYMGLMEALALSFVEP